MKKKGKNRGIWKGEEKIEEYEKRRIKQRHMKGERKKQRNMERKGKKNRKIMKGKENIKEYEENRGLWKNWRMWGGG